MGIGNNALDLFLGVMTHCDIKAVTLAYILRYILTNNIQQVTYITMLLIILGYCPGNTSARAMPQHKQTLTPKCSMA